MPNNTHTNSQLCLSGASGLVGTALKEHLLKQGHQLRILQRRSPTENTYWDPRNDQLKPESLANCHALIHLSGANIAQRPWTKARKRMLIESRIRSTDLLVKTIAKLPADKRPQTLVCASAIGYYPFGEAPMDEQTPAGSGFLSALCQHWEKSAQKAKEHGLRVVCLRIGLVLSTQGGLLKTLNTLQRFHLLFSFGSAQQYISWIHIADLIALFEQAATNPSWEGVYNAATPHPERQAELLRLLSRLRHKAPPWLPPLNGAVLRLLLGDMADLLLQSQYVLPTRALKQGFSFQFPTLESALKDLLRNASV